VIHCDIGPVAGQQSEDVAVKPILICFAVMLMTTGLASAADPIIGNWKTTLGETAAIAPCGGGFCITLKSGKHAGEKIGAFEGGGGSYSGKITDPEAKKTYNGTISISGDTVTLKGCVMKVVCESQKWARQ
jgi:uncharacterized protein (DUF2147 family)